MFLIIHTIIARRSVSQIVFLTTKDDKYLILVYEDFLVWTSQNTLSRFRSQNNGHVLKYVLILVCQIFCSWKNGVVLNFVLKDNPYLILVYQASQIVFQYLEYSWIMCQYSLIDEVLIFVLIFLDWMFCNIAVIIQLEKVTICM